MIEAIGFMLLQSIALAFYLFMPLWAHLITLRSLQRKVPEQAESPRYSLADIMILMALISIGTALGSYAKIDQDAENWILIVSLNLLLILMWYKCNRLMRINAINENKSRILMQVFTYPSSVLALSFLLLSGISALTGDDQSSTPERARE